MYLPLGVDGVASPLVYLFGVLGVVGLGSSGEGLNVEADDDTGLVSAETAGDMSSRCMLLGCCTGRSVGASALPGTTETGCSGA